MSIHALIACMGNVVTPALGADTVWICGGISGNTLKTACQTYNLGSGSVASAATLNTARMAGGGSSDNTSKAVITHGYNAGTGLGYTNVTEKISLPSGLWATSATVTNNFGRTGSACSTGAHSFIAGSDNTTDNATTNKTSKYNFSADTEAAGTNLGNSFYARSGSHGDSAASFTFGGSATTTTVEKYTHSGNTVAAATALGVGVSWGSAAGNSTHAFVGNHGAAGSTNTRKYTMASQSDAAGTALSATCGYSEGCGSNNAKQLWTGGNTSGTAIVLYTFSGDTTANGTAITDTGRGPVVFAEKPGGLN